MLLAFWCPECLPKTESRGGPACVRVSRVCLSRSGFAIFSISSQFLSVGLHASQTLTHSNPTDMEWFVSVGLQLGPLRRALGRWSGSAPVIVAFIIITHHHSSSSSSSSSFIIPVLRSEDGVRLLLAVVQDVCSLDHLPTGGHGLLSGSSSPSPSLSSFNVSSTVVMSFGSYDHAVSSSSIIIVTHYHDHHHRHRGDRQLHHHHYHHHRGVEPKGGSTQPPFPLQIVGLLSERGSVIWFRWVVSSWRKLSPWVSFETDPFLLWMVGAAPPRFWQRR